MVQVIIRRLFILSIINIAVSVMALLIGGLAVQSSNGKFPYNAGGAIIVGTFAIFLSCCPMFMYCGQSSDNSCCVLLLAIYFGVVILSPPLGIGMSGIYGLVECGKPDGGTQGVCADNKDYKVTMCVLTILVSTALMILELCIFFTCCCNSSELGLPLLTPTTDHYWSESNQRSRAREIAEARLRQEQEQFRQLHRSEFRQHSRTSRPAALSVIGGDIDYGVDNTTNLDDSELHVDLSGNASITHETDIDHITHEDQPPSYETTRDNIRHNDPPPSYDEVMRTT